MQEVTGSSPVSPTTSPVIGRAAESVERDAPRGADPQRAGSRLETRRRGSVAAPPVSGRRTGPGRRPLPRRRVRHQAAAKAGGTAGVNLSSCRGTRGFVILEEANRMSQEQDSVAVVGTADADDPVEIGLEAPERGSADELMDHGAGGELGPMRHSAAHVLAEAVMDLFPGTKLGIGPVIADGFYYDLLLPRPLTPDDLPVIEARMRESIAADHPFELSEMTPAEARAFMVEC